MFAETRSKLVFSSRFSIRSLAPAKADLTSESGFLRNLKKCPQEMRRITFCEGGVFRAPGGRRQKLRPTLDLGGAILVFRFLNGEKLGGLYKTGSARPLASSSSASCCSKALLRVFNLRAGAPQ